MGIGSRPRISRGEDMLVLEKQSVIPKTGAPEAALYFGGAHEGVPDEAAAQIFCHDHRDAGIDADHVCVVPVRQRIKSVHESIRCPCLGAVLFADGSKYSQRRVREEWQRPPGSAG